jgi:hypothetical protein
VWTNPVTAADVTVRDVWSPAAVEYEVRRGGAATALGAWRTASDAEVFGRLAAGASWCVRARAVDAFAQLSAYTPAGCLTRPLPATALTASRGWQTQRDAASLAGRVLVSTRRGASLSEQVHAQALGVVYTACPTCGIVEVSWRGQFIAAFRTTAPNVRRSLVRTVTVPPGAGRVVLRAADGKRSIRIEGLAPIKGVATTP